jgi:superfamily II DNA or RNA helicase
MLFLEGGRPFMGSTNFWQWRQDHMQPTGFDWAVKGASLNVLRQEVRARSFFMTRREAGIPDEKLRQTRWVQLPAKVLKAIKQARKEFAVGDRLTNNVLTAMQWECQLAGGRFPTLEHDAKFVELEELLAGEFKNQQVVVWARYTAELEAAGSRLEKAKIRCALVNGDVDRDERERRIAAFKAGRTRVLIAQPQCLKMGVDLSEAEVAIVLSNYFNLEVRAQMEDRIVHPKKARPALIVDLVAENTIDEDVLDALTDKRREAGVFNSRLMKIARSMKS